MRHDYTYLDALEQVKHFGVDKGDRTGTGTRSIFGYQMRFDLAGGFPLLTTKKVHFKSIIHELLWFISGNTNTKYLTDNGVTIWNEWADENGDLGPVYGKQWRDWQHTRTEWFEQVEYDMMGEAWETNVPTPIEESIDQLAQVVETLKTNPNCRRNIVSAWNVGEVPRMKLPPCHLLFQFYVAEGKLSCQLYQRSCDMFLGVPFNIASYSALIHMMAHICDLEVGEFIWTGGDCHIYSNHMDQVDTQLERTPQTSPTLTIAPDAPKSLDGWKLEHFVLDGYDPDPGIRAKVAI